MVVVRSADSSHTIKQPLDQVDAVTGMSGNMNELEQRTGGRWPLHLIRRRSARRGRRVLRSSWPNPPTPVHPIHTSQPSSVSLILTPFGSFANQTLIWRLVCKFDANIWPLIIESEVNFSVCCKFENRCANFDMTNHYPQSSD